MLASILDQVGLLDLFLDGLCGRAYQRFSFVLIPRTFFLFAYREALFGLFKRHASQLVKCITLVLAMEEQCGCLVPLFYFLYLKVIKIAK